MKKVDFDSKSPFEYRITSRSNYWWPLSSDKKIDDFDGLALESARDYCNIRDGENVFENNEQFWVDVREIGKNKKFSSVVKFDGNNFITGEKSVKINAIQCLNCKDIIFSRARHDYMSCSCRKVAIDGGFDYNKISYEREFPISIPLKLNVSKADLYNDWNHYEVKYGKLTVKEAIPFICGEIKGCFDGTIIPFKDWRNGKIPELKGFREKQEAVDFNI